MTPETIYRIGQDAMVVAVKLTAPVLLPSLVIGLIIAMFQAATQINEQTLSFIPKLVITFLTLLLAGPWMLRLLIEFSNHMITSIPSILAN